MRSTDTPRPTSRRGQDETQGSLFSRADAPEAAFGSLRLGWVDPAPTTEKKPDLSGSVIGLGSKVRIENLVDGTKKAFTLVGSQNNLTDGELSIFSPLGQALLEAREGEEVEYQVGVDLREVRVLTVSAS
ncbi:hypothetical protein E4L95_00915 [Paracoccus liaowanqingii]|uniref:Transcription elongation factor GreA/GreB C-terminal domain-containing protein n=1 Tax=Paracoccus liaowanqingii TaxID=2560053 RepID=A0A4Z1CT23_9RHOB|nr:GreA/GreB family elongation factor [Paracoccus liaowanqingii]TGN68546.1 hypothetical protein E4L95_00915 [Paracoccus liaowanqingii]